MQSDTYSKVIQPHSNLTTRINQIKSCFYSGLLQPTRGQGPSLLFVNTQRSITDWRGCHFASITMATSHTHTHTYIEFAFHISVNVVTFGSWFSKAATYKYVHSLYGCVAILVSVNGKFLDPDLSLVDVPAIPYLRLWVVSPWSIQFPMSVNLL